MTFGSNMMMDSGGGASLWQKVGNSLIGTLPEQVAVLSPTRAVAFSVNTNTLIAYDFNGTDWVQVGSASPFAVEIIANTIAALSSTQIVHLDVSNSNAPKIHIYNFNGSVWSEVGVPTPFFSAVFNSGSSVCVTSPTQIEVSNAQFGAIEGYTYNGSSWLTTTFSSVALSSSSSCTKLSPTRLAVLTAINVRIFDFNGTIWVQVGNTYPLPITGGSTTIAKITSTRIVVYNKFGNGMQVLDFDGTNLTPFGGPFLPTTATQPTLYIKQLDSLNNLFIIVESFSKISTYRFLG